MEKAGVRFDEGDVEGSEPLGHWIRGKALNAHDITVGSEEVV